MTRLLHYLQHRTCVRRWGCLWTSGACLASWHSVRRRNKLTDTGYCLTLLP